MLMGLPLHAAGSLGAAGTTYRIAGHTIGTAAMVSVSLTVAIVGTLVRPLWRVGRLAVTAVHEGGHAVAAVLGGRRVTAVHLRSDTSGVTFHQGTGRWGGRVMTAAAGYPAPGVLAVAGSALVAHHQSRVWLAVLAGLGAVMVIRWVRNLFGITLLAAGVGGLGWLVVSGSAGVTALVATVAVWYLAIGGVRAAFEEFGDRSTTDADEVGRRLHLPALVCKAGFVMVASAALAGCAALLFRLS
jgi:hypothetical protein